MFFPPPLVVVGSDIRDPDSESGSIPGISFEIIVQFQLICVLLQGMELSSIRQVRDHLRRICRSRRIFQ